MEASNIKNNTSKITDNKIESEIQKSFGFVNNTLINIYSDENPILNIDDECYFLFTNPIDIHRTIIGKGVVHNMIFNDGMNIIYFIGLNDVIESTGIKNKFVYGKKFILNKIGLGNHSVKQIIITEKTSIEFLNKYLFKIEGFFVRKSLEEIKKLQHEYSLIINEDLVNQISDINLILTNYGPKTQ